MTEFADRLHVSINVVEALITPLRERKLVEYDGMEGRAYRWPSPSGPRRTSPIRSKECRYTGPMPVPRTRSTPRSSGHRSPPLHLNRDLLSKSVHRPGDLPDAARRARPGDPRLRRHVPLRPSRHRQDAASPSASSACLRATRARAPCVEVDGQIITVFDPIVHEPVAEQPDRASTPAGCCAGARRSSPAASSSMSMLDLTLRAATAASTSRRCRCRPTTACSSSTTSAARR